MKFDFGREVCGDLPTATRREWLVTNGIGGFASGTIANVLTRRYHGLLMAALNPPLGRTLLLAKLDETAEYDGIYPDSGRFYPLYTNRWEDGTVDGNGHVYLDRFHLEGTTPVWTFALANALLEKRVWMQPGANTTYVQYRLTRATGPLSLSIKALVNYRDYHATTIINDWDPEMKSLTVPGGSGLRIRMFDEAAPFYLFSDRAEITPQFDWYEDLFLSVEEYRGQRDVSEDHIYAAQLQITLRQGETFAIVASTDGAPTLDSAAAWEERRDYERGLLERAAGLRSNAQTKLPRPLEQLVLAADQFVVSRPSAADPDGKSIIAGYHWFSDWGRDTMIALPGLTLTTGRPEVAAGVLRTFARFVDRGMLPNRFPDAGETPEYNTVDATLWYFIAL
ncbi:MAG TPA: glycogen debranching enzyme N-terminal domain-containing protein, partial [Promineifilum sp.]|nr:glycogen debranching enzyme N-terminal domain-containing protein [Promineifilum sp.]